MRYERKIWQRGRRDWCWAIRFNGVVVVRGEQAASHPKAKEAALDAIATHKAEQAAYWVTVTP